MLPDLLGVQVKSYYFRHDEAQRPQIGFLAQEIAPLFPELVIAPAPGTEEVYTVDYAGFSMVAIKAIQEQQAAIAALQAQVEAQSVLIQTLFEAR